MKASIDLWAARRCAIAATGLGGLGRSGSEGSLAAIRRLGSVQIDTISVVERAHHHILWTRVPGYSPGHLQELETEPRRIIEYWSHAASYIPIEEFRFCIPRMNRVRANGHDWFKADQKAVAFVLDRITAEGPLRAQDFERAARKRAGWWDWKPAKVALEYLFHSGELVSVERRGFQKVYDLASRALPSGLDRSLPTAEALAAHHLDRAAASLGVFAADDIAYMRRDGIEGIDAELSARLADGRLVELDIPPLGPGQARGKRRRGWFAAPGILESLRLPPTAFPGKSRSRAFILSPFDPLIIDRRRASRLFGLDYQLECYVPEGKRKFGYFGLPILYSEQDGHDMFLGLLDAKADRQDACLRIRRLSLSRPSKGPPAERIGRLVAEEILRFARFNGADRVLLEREEIADAGISAALRKGLDQRLA